MFAFEIPTPKRARKRVNAFTARPLQKTMTAKARLAKPTTRERRHRSARYPIGSAPSTKNALEAAVMNVMTPLEMPKVSRMSGARMPSAAFSSSSRLFSNSRIVNVNAPPRSRPCLRVIGSSPTPASVSSSRSRSRSSAWAASRSASASRTLADIAASVPWAAGELSVTERFSDTRRDQCHPGQSSIA